MRVVPPDDLPRFLLRLLVALIAYVSIHEAGHVVAAIHQGFRILTFSIWPLALEWKADKWRLKLLGKPRVLGADGSGEVRQPRMYRFMRQKRPINDATFEVEFLDSGVAVFAFTFG